MDKCYSIFTGTVEYAKERRMGTFSWGTVNARVLLNKKNFKLLDTQIDIVNPTLWINIKTEYNNDKLTPRDQAVLDNCLAKKFVCVAGGKLSSYVSEPKDATGKVIQGAPKDTKYTMDVSPSCIYFSDRPYKEINLTTIEGFVLENGQNGRLLIRVPYRSKEEVKYKEVAVINPMGFDGSLNNKKIIVVGSLFGKLPDRSDSIYVVADTIEILK